MSTKYVPIDGAVAAKIVELHTKYPKLGHHGILKALNDEGIKVHADELDAFMKGNHIEAEKAWRPLGTRGAPGRLGGRPEALR
jgi:hypothetical protein